MQVFTDGVQVVALIPMALGIVYWGGLSIVGGLAYLGFSGVVLAVLLGLLGFAQNASYKENQVQASEGTVRAVYKGKPR
jgi:hypothetical protein